LFLHVADHPSSERVPWESPSIAGTTFLILALGVTLLVTGVTTLVPEMAARFVSDWGGQGDPSGLFTKWSVMLFYPFTILRLFSPAEAPWLFFDLFHCVVAVAGIYLAALRWSGSGWLAFCSSLLIVPCATLGLVSASGMVALAWAPWLLLSAEAAFAKGEKHIIVCATVAATQLLSGSIEIIVITWICGAICAGSVFIQNSLRTWPRFKRFGAVALLAFLLAATQVVPLMDVRPNSEGSSSGSDVDIEQRNRPTLANDEQFLALLTF
jgi:hypothetical protein